MALKKLSAGNGPEILVPITQNYIDKCIEKHITVLVNLIRSDHAPPADGAIKNIVDAIHILRTTVIASDDKAGRGLGSDIDG